MSIPNKPRPFEEVKDGKYDSNGFYRTPNGSFWDPDGVYFNREGKDVHGGYYDDKLEYHPGKGWIESLMCYEDEVGNGEVAEDDGDYEDGDYDVYEDFNDDLKEGYNGPSYYSVQEKEISKTQKPAVEKKKEEIKSTEVKDVKEALKANKKVECQGYEISEL